MYAAVVRSFDHAPRYEELELPARSPQDPAQADEVIVKVLAAGLHPRVRSGASGAHYADERVLPMIPGIDAVGELPDGKRVYCVVHDTPFGTMAEQVIADRRRCVALPDGVDPALLAAAMNPAMSSWIALRMRTQIEPGQRVLVIGATGNAGQMAIQVAKRLGAGRVVAAGRAIDKLAGSAADQIVGLEGDPAKVGRALAEAAADVDIVLDYVWGEPAVQAMMALAKGRADRSRPLDWIQIGSVAGPDIALPSALLRSTNLRVMGSGQGSVSARAIVAELPQLVAELAAGALPVVAESVPLSKVEETWNAPGPEGKRVVFVP